MVSRGAHLSAGEGQARASLAAGGVYPDFYVSSPGPAHDCALLRCVIRGDPDLRVVVVAGCRETLEPDLVELLDWMMLVGYNVRVCLWPQA